MGKGLGCGRFVSRSDVPGPGTRGMQKPGLSPGHTRSPDEGSLDGRGVNGEWPVFGQCGLEV